MTALQAKEKSEGYYSGFNERLYNDIMNDIEKCANHGIFNLWYDSPISHVIINRLREQGYRVELSADQTKLKTIISWHE